MSSVTCVAVGVRADSLRVGTAVGDVDIGFRVGVGVSVG